MMQMLLYKTLKKMEKRKEIYSYSEVYNIPSLLLAISYFGEFRVCEV